MLYFADVSTGMFSVVLRGCSFPTLSTGTLLFLGRCPYALASEGVDGRSLKKCFIQLFLSKLSRDSDSGGYGVTLLGTKPSSCEGLRIFEESLISFLCSSTSLFLLNCFLYY